MTLQIYLDDCPTNRALIRQLESAGHEVVVPLQVGLAGADDEVHFEFARRSGRVLLTLNPADFMVLHRRQADHPGLLLVYQDNDPARDMSAMDIARAISNLLESGIPIAGQIHVLNHWRY